MIHLFLTIYIFLTLSKQITGVQGETSSYDTTGEQHNSALRATLMFWSFKKFDNRDNILVFFSECKKKIDKKTFLNI